MQNCFGIALRSNVGNLAFMKSACMASMYHICGYHDNCPKPADTCCQYYKDKQDNTNYYKSKGDFPINVRRAILLIYQSLCKSDIMEKCLHGKTQNANESFNGMIWNCVLKATHVGLDFISVGVYDSIAHFNIGEKAALDIIEQPKIAPGYCMTKCCRSVNKRRKRSSIYRMSEPQKKGRKVLRHSRKKQQDKNNETEGTSYEKLSF